MSVSLPLLFFLLLIPLSGFIAWSGDKIGHRIGKRRHTFLGMRPRHTATVTTVAAGMLIALVSFGLMWASNERFRILLAEGDMLLEDNKKMKRENQRLQTVVAEQGQLAIRMREDASAALYARDKAVEAREAAEDTLAEARKKEQAARAELAAAQGDVKTTRQELAKKEAAVKAAGATVKAARQRLLAATQRAQAAESEAEAAERFAKSVERTGDTLVRRVKEVTEELNEQQTQVAGLQTEYERQKAELAIVTRDLAAKRSEMNEMLGQTLKNTTALRRNPITFVVDEEIERAALASGLPKEEIKAALRSLLDSAATKAEERGAASGPTGRAVFILPKPAPLAGTVDTAGDDDADIISEEESIAAAADAIQRDGEDVAVLLVAAVNAVEGEPVPVEFRTYRNPRVLRRNAVVGRLPLDGTLPQQAVAEALYAFLRTDVRKHLRESGIIPPALGGRDEQDAESSIVSISGAQWLRVLDDVRRAGRSAEVVVRAAKDLRAADPVALTFEVNGIRGLSVR